MTVPSLGEFELTVLLCVSRLGDEAYGLRIRGEIAALRQRNYAVGAIYTTLQRLEDKGLVKSRMSDPLPVRGGRSRREYVVTASGNRALRNARSLAERMWAPLDLDARPV